MLRNLRMPQIINDTVIFIYIVDTSYFRTELYLNFVISNPQWLISHLIKKIAPYLTLPTSNWYGLGGI